MARYMANARRKISEDCSPPTEMATKFPGLILAAITLISSALGYRE